MNIVTKTKVIVVTACECCPHHSSTICAQLDEGDSLDKHYYAEQHICLKTIPGEKSWKVWWTDDRTSEPPAIQEWCPLADR